MLTLSIVLIEVILISAVMLGPGEHATIARDSVMAVAMIILNLVIGLALLLGGLRHRGMAHNRTGTSAYLSMLVVLVALAFGLPALIGTDGSYTTAQEIPIIVLTLVLYAFFLYRQMGAQASDFTEVDPRLLQTVEDQEKGEASGGIRQVLSAHRTEVVVRLALLVVTVIPIVLLSHDMAALLDDGLGRLGAPVALAGVLIAGIVFLPESITAVRAALGGEAQRVSLWARASACLTTPNAQARITTMIAPSAITSTGTGTGGSRTGWKRRRAAKAPHPNATRTISVTPINCLSSVRDIAGLLRGGAVPDLPHRRRSSSVVVSRPTVANRVGAVVLRREHSENGMKATSTERCVFFPGQKEI